MSAIRNIPVRARIFIVMAVLGFCGGVPLLLTQYEDEASRVPSQWEFDYRDASVAQIVDRLGPPQEKAEAKQFMNWLMPAKGGTRMLKVICPQDCSDGERPAAVLYLFFREVGHGPVRSRDLLKSHR